MSARWAQLSNAAFLIDSKTASVEVAIDTVLEVFDASIDPVDDFEGAAVRRFVLSFRRALEGIQGDTP